MKSRIPAVLVLCAAAFLTPVAQAAIVTFVATGNFENGSTLSGFVTIDTATGVAGASDLAVSGNAAHFTTLNLQTPWPSSGSFLTELSLSNGQATDNLLTLLFPPVSLIGYGGGNLCGSSNDPSCFDGTLHYTSNFATKLPDNTIPGNSFVRLVDGSLTPMAVPEPSTAVIGLVGLALAVIRRLRARS